MAIREYVGARYVPRFTGLYNATQVYDALDVVDNGAGTSYIAKKTVPAGTPLTDTDFWFIYGASSGAIINLQNQIDTINNTDLPALDGRVGTLESDVATMKSADIHSIWHNKKVCIYGDSLSDLSGDVYWEYLATREPSIQFTNRAVGGSTIDQARTLISSATDLQTYDIIVIAFGTNEWQSSWGYDSIKYRFESTFEILKTKIATNPSEKVFVITPFYSYRNFSGTGTEANHAGLTIDMVNDAIAEVANKYSYPVLNLFFASSCNSSNYMYRLENSGGIYVHEIGDFSEELSYIVEKWDGESYIARKYVGGRNACSPIEFCKYTKRLTKAEYDSIPAGFRDGVSMKIQGGTSTKWAYGRYLSKDVDYMIRVWADNVIAISLMNASDVRIWSQTCNGSTEFKTMVRVPANGYYKLIINTDPGISETIVGGLYFGRYDGVDIPSDWHKATAVDATGDISFKYDDDTFALSSGALTAMTGGNVLTFPEMSDLPSMFIPVMGASATTPTMTTAIVENSGMQVLNTGVGVTYVPATVLKAKCYTFDI